MHRKCRCTGILRQWVFLCFVLFPNWELAVLRDCSEQPAVQTDTPWAPGQETCAPSSGSASSSPDLLAFWRRKQMRNQFSSLREGLKHGDLNKALVPQRGVRTAPPAPAQVLPPSHLSLCGDGRGPCSVTRFHPLRNRDVWKWVTPPSILHGSPPRP